MGIVGTADRQW